MDKVNKAVGMARKHRLNETAKLIQDQAYRIEALESELRHYKHEVVETALANEKDAADRIEALEARIAKADALADILQSAIIEHDTTDYQPDEENPWTMQEWFSDEDRAALAAYREGSDT